MQPYVNAKAKALNNMNLEICSIISGKTKEQLVDTGKKAAPKWKKALPIVVPILLFGRWAYTKYGRSEDVAEIVDEHEL